MVFGKSTCTGNSECLLSELRRLFCRYSATGRAWPRFPWPKNRHEGFFGESYFGEDDPCRQPRPRYEDELIRVLLRTRHHRRPRGESLGLNGHRKLLAGSAQPVPPPETDHSQVPQPSSLPRRPSTRIPNHHLHLSLHLQCRRTKARARRWRQTHTHTHTPHTKSPQLCSRVQPRRRRR